MVARYREFYERAGELYPEDKFTYSSLSGIMRKKWVTRKIAQLPPGNLLDCGCNIGRLAAEWKRGMVIGVDIAFALLKKGKNLYPDINFIQGDLMNLRFLKPNSIDNALAIEVIEHLPRVDDFLKELTKVLKTNGTVLVTTPSYSRKRPVFTKIGILKSFGIKEGVEGEYYLHTAYKPEELKSLLENAGFEVVEYGSFEFETRGWVKPFTLLNRFYEGLAERFFPCSRLNIFFMGLVNRIELNIFYILDTIGLSWFIKKFFKEGRRTYVLARKPE